MIFSLFSTLVNWLPLYAAIIYPCIKLASEWHNEKSDKMKTQWMVYWVIAGLYFFLKSVLYLHYVPLIWLPETIVAAWLVHPKTLGALYLHKVFIDDLFANVIEKQVAPIFKNILSKVPL